MNLLLVERRELGEDGLGADVVVLRDRRAEHLRKVLKVEVGQELKVGIVGGLQGRGTVRAVDGDAVELQVDVPAGPAPRPDVDLIVGLPRPQALHRVLQTAAVMGVARLDLVKSWRVEKSFFQSPSLADDNVARQLLLGAEQGRNTFLPEVRTQKLLVPFVRGLEDEGKTLRLIAHPEAEATLEDLVEPFLGNPSVGPAGRFLIAIGPEGGWIDREVQTFGEEGFLPVYLGPWILKVENAVTAVLAQLEMVRRRSVPDMDRSGS